MEKLPLTDGNWCYSRRPGRGDPRQGWKIHVSATLLSADEVFSRTFPILRKYNAFYKVPSRPELIASLNSGLLNFSQVGKILTVYPRSTDEATNLARELHRATRGLPGPRIPFDEPYRPNSLVHYRYGSFRRSVNGGIIRGPDGTQLVDKREHGRAVPDWIRNPFREVPQNVCRRKGPIGVELLAYKAKMQRGKGGVYEALDLSVSPARRIIIKEGRRHGETDGHGQDGYARIQHEARVWRALSRADVPVPDLLREFSQDGNRYIVLERIKGRLLIPRGRTHPKQISWRRAAKILEQLGGLISRIHAAGWVWRDCKPSHIFMRRGGMRLIDFEGACRLDDTQALPWSSPNYVPPNYERRLSRRAGTLEDDYALGVIAFQFGTGEFPPANARRRTCCYKRTGCPDSLRARIETLLQI